MSDTTRHRRWPRWARWALVLGGLAGALLLLPATAPFESLVRRAVEAAAGRSGVDLRLGDLQIRPWRFRLDLQAVEAATEIEGATLELSIPEARLGLVGGARLEVHASAPRLSYAAGSAEPAAGPDDTGEIDITRLLESLRLARLMVQDGTIEVEAADGAGRVGVLGAALELERGAPGRYGLHFATGSGSVSIGEREIATGALDLAAVLDGPRIEIESTRLERDNSWLTLDGSVALTEVATSELRLQLQLASDLVEELGQPASVRGEVAGSATLRLQPDGLWVEADLETTSVYWEQLGPWQATASIAAEPERVRISDLQVGGYGGDARGGATWDLVDDRQQLSLGLERLDLVALFADGLQADLPVELEASGEIALHTSAWSTQEVRGDARVALDGGAPGGDPALRARSDARVVGETLALDSTRLAFGPGSASLTGRLDRDGSLDADFELEIDDLGDLEPTFRLFGVEPPPVELAGAVQLAGAVAGAVDAPRGSARLASRGLRVGAESVAVDGTLDASATGAQLDLGGAAGGGGRLQVAGLVPWGPDSPELDLRLTARRVDLCSLAALSRLPVCALLDAEGSLSGDLAAPRLALEGSLADLRTRGPDAEADAATGGDAAFRISMLNGRVELEQLEARIDGGSLTATGHWDPGADEIALSLQAHRLPIEIDRPPMANPLVGRLDLGAEVSGAASAPRGTAHLALHDVELSGTTLPDLTGSVELDGEEATARLAFDQSPLLASARVGLQRPWPASAQAHLEGLPEQLLATLAEPLPQALTDVTLAGRLTAELEIADLESLGWSAQIDRLAATYGGHRLATGAFEAEGDLRQASLDEVELQVDDGVLRAAGRVPLSEESDFELDVAGVLPLDLLSSAAIQADGSARADLSVRGQLASPLVEGEVRLESATGTVAGVDWHDLVVVATFDDRGVEIGEAHARLLDGEVRLRGRSPLWQPTGPERPELHVEVDDLDLYRLMPPPPGGHLAQLRITADATTTGRLLEPETLVGSGQVSSISIGRPGSEARNSRPARLALNEGVLRIDDLSVAGERTDFQVDLRTAITSPADDLEAHLRGRIELGDMAVLTSSLPGLRILGETALDLRVSGDGGGFVLDGDGSLRDGSVTGGSPAFLISDLEADLDFAGETIEVSRLVGRMSGGTLEGRATIDMRDLTALESIELEARAEGVNLEVDEGVRTQFSGEVSFTGEGDRYRLGGDFRLQNAVFTAELEGASSEQDSLRSVRATLVEEDSAQAPFANRVDLDLRLGTANDVRVSNELARFAAAGNLRVGGTLAHPDVRGTVSTVGQGEIRLGRHLFDLERAGVDLLNFPDEPPRVDLFAVSRISDYVVEVSVRGPIDDIETVLSSPDPSLTQADLSSLLLSGRLADSESGSNPVLQAEAASYLGNLFQEQLGLGLVFDTPAALPVLASESDTESRISVGRRVTDEITVSYSVGMAEADSQSWILDYQPLQRLWLRAMQTSGQAYTFEVAHRLHFDFRPHHAAPAEAGSRQRVGSVTLDIDRPPPGENLMTQVGVASGDRYDFWRTQRDAEALARHLAVRGHRGALVTSSTSVNESGAVDVVYHVEPGPRVSFDWRGDDPGDRLRSDIEGRWGPLLPPDLQAQALAQDAVVELRARRHFDASVTSEISGDDEAVQVIFEVELGAAGEQVLVLFEGNHSIADEELAALLPNPDSALFHSRLESNLRRIRQPLEERYARDGFLRAEIGEPRLELLPNSHDLQVTIPVVEGPAFVVESIILSGGEQLDEQLLREHIELEEGETFTIGPYSSIPRELRRIYREEGFLDANVDTRIHRAGEEAIEVRIEIDEGKRAYIGDIEIRGNLHTREATVRRQISLRAGEALRASDLADTRRALYKLGVFRSVDITHREGTTAGTRDLVITLVGRNDLLFDYGLRYRTGDVENLSPTVRDIEPEGLEAVFRVQLLEPFRRADTASLSLFGSTSRQKLLLGYHFPHFAGSYLPTRLSLEGEQEELDFRFADLDSSTLTFTAEQTRELGQRLRLNYGFQWQRGRTESEPPDIETFGLFRLDETVQRNKLIASLVHDGRDNVMNPRRGHHFFTALHWGPEAIGADYESTRIFSQFALYVPLGKGPRSPVWASSYRAGAIFSSELFFDFEDRFTAGGPFSVRGFEPNGLGPRIPELDETIGGRGVVILNQELRFPLYRDLWGGVFYDTGEVFLRPEDIDLGKLRESVGVGLRYDLGFGVFRLDFAHVLDRRDGEPVEQVHFTFGQAF
jgi:outer membrane protein insertion porin family